MRYLLILFSLLFISCQLDAQLGPAQSALFLNTSPEAAHPPQLLEVNDQIGIVIWGQSNALGFNSPDVPDTSPINYQNAIVGTQILINGTTNFNTLKYAVNSQGTNFGCNLSLGYELYLTTDRPTFMGLEAGNGNSLYNNVGHDNYSPAATGGDRSIDDLLTVFLAVQTKCAMYGKTPFIISVFIGTEADSDDAPADIRENYEATIGYLESNGVNIDAHIISILKETYGGGATPSDIATVRAQMNAYCNENGDAWALDMNPFEFEADSIHFTGQGQEAIGIAISDIITDDIFGLGLETYPGSYSADAKSALKNFRTDISTGYKDAIADFVDGLQADGNLDNLVICQVRSMENTAQAFTDIMGVKYGLYVSGTHDPGGGITYNGTSEYSSTEFQCDSDGGSLYTLNTAGWGFYVVDNLTSAGTAGYLGGFNALGSTNMYIAQGASSQLAYATHSNAGGTYTGETAFADGFLYLARRTASTGAGSTGLIKGSTAVDTDNVTSNSLGNRKVYEGAKNNIGTADSFWNGKTGLFVVFNPTSFDYAAFKTRVDTLIADLAAL